MDRVSVRNLKNQLSAYLRRVESGTRLVVTDRGRPIAELGPVQPEDISPAEALQKMADAGELVPPQGKGFSRFRPISVEGAALSTAILDERKERF
jgi:prevent-host-death family protein